MFSTVRIRAAKPTGQTFDRHSEFDITTYLGNSFRAVRGDGDQTWTVCLQFHPERPGIHSGLKGRSMSAQGSRLGFANSQTCECPERA